jgi:hypothetical protein
MWVMGENVKSIETAHMRFLRSLLGIACRRITKEEAAASIASLQRLSLLEADALHKDRYHPNLGKINEIERALGEQAQF